jgi:transposase
LAVERVLEGNTQQEVAEFLGVAKSSLSSWMKAYRRDGWAALSAKPHPGKPRKLTPQQDQKVLSWFRRSPTEFGFGNELWTAKRVTQLIRQEFQVEFNSRYISHWLAERRITPQKPRRQPRERNEQTIEEWVRKEWPRLKNARCAFART